MLRCCPNDGACKNVVSYERLCHNESKPRKRRQEPRPVPTVVGYLQQQYLCPDIPHYRVDRQREHLLVSDKDTLMD